MAHEKVIMTIRILLVIKEQQFYCIWKVILLLLKDVSPWGYRDHVLLKLGRILSVGGATLSFATLQMQDVAIWAWLIWIVRTIKGGVWIRQWTFEIHIKAGNFLISSTGTPPCAVNHRFNLYIYIRWILASCAVPTMLKSVKGDICLTVHRWYV